MFDLIKKYPKIRGFLPKPLKKIFNKFYLDNRENSLSQLLRRWMHLSMDDREKNKITLEIGSGNLNHIKYEKKKHYDIIEPKKFLYKKSIYKKFINKDYKNIRQTKNNYYDRIISCAVLEHMTNLPEYLYISSLKLKKRGYQQHSIPCEGYPMWHICWSLYTGMIFKLKYGYSFKYIQKHEHVNNFDEIVSLIKFFYKNVEKIKFSYPLYNKYLSLYANIKFSNPHKENINKYLKFKKDSIINSIKKN
jgi:hypothetical protein